MMMGRYVCFYIIAQGKCIPCELLYEFFFYIGMVIKEDKVSRSLDDTIYLDDNTSCA